MEFSFDDFKRRANNSELSKWEKIGFPDSYRNGIEKQIFEDIKLKLNLEDSKMILDIGCGCSELVEHMIQYSDTQEKSLFLVDSSEMLLNIDNSTLGNNIHLVPGCFPDDNVKTKLSTESFDAILVYSVLQYIFIEQSIFSFIHECLKLLKPGGRLLLGDIPNFQSRERFLDSAKGREFLSNTVQNTINLEHANEERIDDSIIMSIMLRFRKFGCETYLVPQPMNLPFANRREDILIIKR
jgi:2-polyprenyl-3-methyl-5-hydroxy-6-metoxy-1,4-benzoquinol methylase